MRNKTLALCYGTRPQVIKASVLRQALGVSWNVYAVDTGQHYDHALNALLYEQLGVRPPHEFLEVGSASQAEQTAGILTRVEQVLRRELPEVVVVIGDTNSTLGCALAAAKLRIPVVHVEAGLRADDRLMAEEVNRRTVDAISSLLCTPGRRCTERMQREHPDVITVETGDVALDVLLGNKMRTPTAASCLGGEAPGRFLYATLHRAELTERPDLLEGVLTALSSASCPVILPAHPRTRLVIESMNAGGGSSGNLRVITPVGYLESLALIQAAVGVVTDSGGVQREAYWLGVPCVTVRSETEWGETVELGANVLVSPASVPIRLAGAIDDILSGRRHRTWDVSAYGHGDAAGRVETAIQKWHS